MEFISKSYLIRYSIYLLAHKELVLFGQAEYVCKSTSSFAL